MTPETRAKLKAVADRTAREKNGKFTDKKAGTPKPAKLPRDEPPARDPVEVDVYFDPQRDKYWTKNAAAEWMPVNKTNVELILRSNWYNQYEKSTNSLTRVELKLLDIIMHHSIHYAGAIAGWQPGLQTICGNRVLVSRGPKIIEPKKGRWDHLKRLIKELLRDEGEYFYAWLLAAYQALKAGAPFSPGQLLVIAGPPKCGKSLLQRLITEMLGGRMGKPYEYLMGETNFNDDMIGAEHLVLDDEVGDKDIRIRRRFAAKIKSTLVNQETRAHPKGARAFIFEPFWRMSFTLNDEAENLMALPPIESDIADKIMLLRATHASFPYPSKEIPTMQAYFDILKAEVPAFLYALHRWKIPERLRELRFGVQAYQNADLLLALSSLAPESKLWSLILQVGILSPNSQTWSGTASELEIELQKSPFAKQAADLLYFPTAAGVYLSRLAKSLPGHVEAEMQSGRKIIYHLALE